MKNEKGITLISLVIAIIVIIILASISIYSATSTLRYAKYNKAKSEIEIIQAQVNKWNQELNDTNITQARFEEIKNYGEKIGNVDSDTSKAIIQTFGDSGINDENLRENYRFFSEQYLKDNLGLDASFDYIISVIDRDTILVGGVYYNGKGYFTLKDFGILNIENNIPSSITFDLEQGENNEIVISNVELHLKNSMQNDNSGDISKFIVEYTKSGENNWTDITKDGVKFEDGEENNKTTKYRISALKYGSYSIRISTIDKGMISIEKNIEIGFKGNSPKLSDGMIPIKYNGENWVICKETDSDWFNYYNKQWANVMLSDGKYKTANQNEYKTDGTTVVDEKDLGSMFVWIPRFAYSINEFRVAKDGEGTTQNITDVSYLIDNTNKDQNGKDYEKDYNIDSVTEGSKTPSIVHPAFTFDGKELTGIWVAKFEASMKEENKNTEENNNVTTKTVKILPNADSWRYITIGNSFFNCINMKNNSIYGLSSNADTHLMKNIEWGAVAYLSASQYGVIPTINNNSEDYTENGSPKVHAYTGGNNYIANISQSTTGNETGIYDLNGGAWERVAAYWDNGNGNLSGQGTSEVFPSNKLNTDYEKYWDKYEVSENEIMQMNDGLWEKDASANGIRKTITDEKYNMMKNTKGDAMYETINTYSYYGKNLSNNYTWLLTETDTSSNHGRSYYNSDLVLFGNCNFTFFYRGGGWNEGVMAGIFDCGGDHRKLQYCYIWISSNFGCEIGKGENGHSISF